MVIPPRGQPGNERKSSAKHIQNKKKERRKMATKIPVSAFSHHDWKPPKKRKAFASIKQRVQIERKAALNSGYSASSTSANKSTYGALSKKALQKAKSRQARMENYKKGKKNKKGTNMRSVGTRNRKRFQMRIPESNEKQHLMLADVPWANRPVHELDDDDDDDESDKEYTNNDNKSLLQLPPENILSSIDADIASFCTYVSLSPVELKAREAFLDEITGLALNQFGKKNGGRNRNNDTEDEIRVVPFGSFATQSVCTFASDVDMCVWGVVKGEKQSEHITFVDADTTEQSQNDDDDDDVLNNAQYQHDNCPLLTESSLLRTMDAIQNAAHADATKSDNDIAATESDKKDEGQQSPPTNDNNDLFFIDRVGEGVGEVDQQAAEPCEKDEIPPETEMTKRSSVASKPASKTGFQFEVDLAGVQELGGDVGDLDQCVESKGGNVQQRQECKSDESDQKPESLKSDQPSGTTPDLAGKRKETAIEINEDNNHDSDGDNSDVIVIDDSDDDDADKMASFYSRQSNSSATADTANSTSTSPINLLHEDDSDCDSASDDVDDSVDDFAQQQQEDEVMEISLTAGRTSQQSLAKPVIGPTGKTRNRVVSVLLSLTNQLRRSSFTHTIECRSRARVPIINCSTRTGFEGDIAIGGHNGVDTSLYALSQVNRFKSFASIVLVMKVLMNQQGLDKPFTGGLGSYKLYVLVAYHIESHIANGGKDRPSEILISLLHRFGCVYTGSRGEKLTTDLVHLSNAGQMLTSDGGTCELTTVFRLPDCVEMFRECHERLFDRFVLVDDMTGGHHQCSYLSSFIDCFSLREAREASKRRAKLCDSITRPIPRNHPGKVSAGRRISHVFTRNDHTPASNANDNKRKSINHEQSYKRSKPDNSNRGPRGGIIPKARPDVAARNSLGAEDALLQRGMKQRKNKKKQARDRELTRFASRHSF